MADHRNLDVYRCAHRLALAVYEATRQLPALENFGLTSQLRRAAISIPSNIAEGAGRGSSKEFIRYLRVAIGSANEVECQLLIAGDLGLIDSATLIGVKDLVVQARRMLQGLISALDNNARS